MSTTDELHRLYERDGHLTPEQIVAEAADPASPLHSSFVWDDTEAAKRYRLAQATGLILRCRITVQTAIDTTVRARAFVHVPAHDDVPATFAPTLDAMGDDRQAVVLQQAQRELAAFMRKYKGLVDIAALIRDMSTEALAA